VLSLWFGLAPAASPAQVVQVDGPNPGERTVMSEVPRAADGVVVRALGIAGPDTTRWALTLIGADAVERVRIVAAGEEVPVLDITMPTEAGEKATVFVPQQGFFALTQTSETQVTINGEQSFALPEPLQQDMEEIYERVL
jgi:hypothetical protein